MKEPIKTMTSPACASGIPSTLMNSGMAAPMKNMSAMNRPEMPSVSFQGAMFSPDMKGKVITGKQ